jgi:acyl-CoA synthetase (AMP-forming)/AMP-acid ligase II
MTDLPPLLPRISDYTKWHAERRPTTAALVLGDNRMSYSALHDAVERLARALIAAGVSKGDRVATLNTPHPDYFVTFLATASIGAIWIGLNPRYRIGELQHVVMDSEPCILFTRLEIEGRQYGEEIATLRRNCPALGRVVAFDGDLPNNADIEKMADFLTLGDTVERDALAAVRDGCGGRDPCLIVYTSGSTGSPKGALLSHDAIALAGLELNLAWPVDPYVALNFFPINHVGCVVDVSTPCFVFGGTMVFMEHYDTRGSMDLIVRERVTLWGSVPSTFQMQLQLDDFNTFDLSAVQLIVWAGAAMPSDMITELGQICPRRATNYGLTETTMAVTIVEPTDDLETLANSVGYPVPGFEVRLADADGKAVAPGQPGEIQTRAVFNLLGYWRRPEATADAFTSDGFFRTGDLAQQRPDGRFRIVGRLKEMYKSGGYNVYPREVEEVLESHPAVSVAAVVSVPDPVWQEVGVAYLIAESTVNVEDLAQFCRERLANYKLPKRLVIQDALPLLPIGKVDKVELKRRAADNV